MRDLIRGGDPVLLSEHTATRTLKPWDRIAARIVRQGPKMILAGGLLAFTFEASLSLFVQLARASCFHYCERLEKIRNWCRKPSDM